MLHNIKVLHLEATDVCQAACPLCARETDFTFRKDQQHHLDMHKIMQVFDVDRISALDKMFMCGNYGDPAAGKNTLDIYKEFRNLNSNIVLGMNSNGALQNVVWWEKLAKIFNRSHDYVVFSIDGLEDTNHIYRKNVDWHKLMQNAKAFIGAGGSAHWDMLVYEHNQHQIEECENFARSLGFRWFRTKVSKRPIINNLRLPVGWTSKSSINTIIDCHALREQSAYIDSKGQLHVCCWLASYTNPAISNINQVSETWNTSNCNPICKKNCASSGNGNIFSSQWRKEIAL